jgi:nitrogen fixation protein NifU and related proteins
VSSDLENLYREVILDHSRFPQGRGLADDPIAESHQLNPTCGDEVTVRLHADGAGARIASVTWTGHGCSISQASASLMHEVLVDLTAAEVTTRIAAFRELMQSKGTSEGDETLLGDAVALAGVSKYVARIKCASLAWVAVEDALTRVELEPTA